MVGGASLVEDGHESTPLRKLKKNIESTLNQHFEEVRSEEGLDLCHLRSSANVSQVAGEKRAWSSGSGMVRAAKKQKSSQLCFLKCNRSDGNLLICSVLSCPVAVHESCAGSSVNVMDSAEFLCPICSWRKADSAYRQTRNEARLVKEKLNLHKNQLSKSKCMLKEFQNQIKLIRKATVEPCTVNDLHHGGGKLRNLNCRNVLNLEKRGKARVIIDLEGEDEETIGDDLFQRGLRNTAHYCPSTSNVEELEIPRNQSKPAAFRSTYTKPDDVCQCHMPTDVEDVEDGQYTGSTRLRRSSPQLVNNFISRRVSTQHTISGRRERVPWTSEEVDKLQEGVWKYSTNGGKTASWTLVLEFGSRIFKPCRTAGDLKDKWRNI